MQELTKAQKGRLDIRAFKTIADALELRGYYKPSGRSGKTLEDALRSISPEIYGTMNDPRCIEIKGLEYVIDRLPRGLEECKRIILTAKEDFEGTTFEKIAPLKRRRLSYRIGEKEICFVITRGLSEIYDLLTHITFLNIEAQKIHNQMKDKNGELSIVWKEFEKDIQKHGNLTGKRLDHAIWNLSILLGRTYRETRTTYEYLEKNKKKHNSNNGLFHIIHQLGKRIEEEELSKDNELLIYFTPSLRHMIGHHQYSHNWALKVKEKISELNLQDRPLHIISANMHSVVNLLYGYSALKNNDLKKTDPDIYCFMQDICKRSDMVKEYAKKHGLYEMTDTSGANIDCQIIDTLMLKNIKLHPEININKMVFDKEKPVIFVMDYAFGTQAFEVMYELLNQNNSENSKKLKDVRSIFIMGKAGILSGKQGDIMLATAHVLEGTPHNYIVNNDLCREDFDDSVDVYTGPIVTVLGTSLQNREVLKRFQTTSWKAVGLEMEGSHYQRAINASIIRGHVLPDVQTGYAYYASDNPLVSGQTLASGGMGTEGIKPTYMITKIFIEKILKYDQKLNSLG